MQNDPLASFSLNDISNEQLSGNIALISHVADPKQGIVHQLKEKFLLITTAEKAPFSFSSWEIKEFKVVYQPDQSFGPVCFAQYTLHNNIIKMTAQLAPVEAVPGHKVIFQQGKREIGKQFTNQRLIVWPGPPIFGWKIRRVQ